MIPYGRQEINEDDISAVVRVLRSDFLTQGPEVPEFERELGAYVGARHCVAMNSATSALHAACAALGVTAGDIVWTSAISFVASANCAVFLGATVEFIDVNPITGNISLDALELMLVEARRERRLPKVVIPVHLAGQPVDMAKISNLASEFGFRVIEDASHALGAAFDGELVGSGLYSDVCVFSFHPVKMVTTGEGGMATTNSRELLERMQRFRSHGITRDSNFARTPVDGDWFYDMIELGYNYRMTDIFAALGRSQLNRLDQFVARRKEVAGQYQEALRNSSCIPLEQHALAESSWHLFVVLVEDASRRKSVFDHLRQEGYLVNVHYRPIYRQFFYAERSRQLPMDFPGAESYYSRAISLPMYPSLEKHHVEKVVNLLNSSPGHQAIF